MIKNTTRILCLVLCLATFLMLFAPLSAHGEEVVAEDGFYFCREALSALPNSEALLYAYDAIVSGVEGSLAEISVTDGKTSLTVDELKVAFDAYTRDHTEHFWLGKEYSVTINSATKKVIALKPSYTLSGDELKEARVAFDGALSEMVSLVGDSMTDYEKELILHDVLASRVEYVDGEHAHDAYGALVLGKAVCEGYAEALQCLLHKAKIVSLIVTGSSKNPTSGASEGHAWNIAKIDGRYYHVDLTWDDQKTNLFHAYFNLTDARIKEDHVIDAPAFALPVCDSETSNYFIKNEKYITGYTVKSIADLLRSGSLVASLYIGSDKDSFISWFNENIRDIANELGIRGTVSYGYLSLGREVFISIDACLHSSLTYVPEKAASCTEDGNIAYYSCKSCQKLFADGNAEVSIYSKDFVRIRALGHAYRENESEELLRSRPVSCLDAYTYFKKCSVCSFVSDTEYYVSSKKGPHTPGEAATVENPQICLVCREILAPKLHLHVPVLNSAKAPGCTTPGNIAYYSCECGKLFSDEACENEIEATELLPKGHGEADFFGICPDCSSIIDYSPIIFIAGGVAVLVIIAVFVVITIKKRREYGY